MWREVREKTEVGRDIEKRGECDDEREICMIGHGTVARREVRCDT